MNIEKTKYAVQPIPTRVRFVGDQQQGRALEGFARKQFARRLEIDGSNRYNKHMVDNRRWPTMKSNRGELITMQMIKGISFITIYVPTGEGGEISLREKLFCFCDCAVTAGIIVKSPSSDEEFPDQWIPESLEIYDGLLCQKEEKRELVQSIIGLDFFAHRDAEPQDLSLDGEDNPIATRAPDNVYAIALEKDIPAEGQDPEHIRQPDVEPCDWDIYALLSIEPLSSHLKVTRTFV